MTETPPPKPDPLIKPPSPWEKLPKVLRTHIADEVAGAVKRGELALSQFERACNERAQKILDDTAARFETLPISRPPTQHELREQIEDAAAEAMSAALPPDREQVAHAQKKLMQMHPRDQEKINAEIDARVKNEKRPNGGRMTIISRVLAKEKWLVALMKDDEAIEEVLSKPAQAEGRWPR